MKAMPATPMLGQPRKVYALAAISAVAAAMASIAAAPNPQGFAGAGLAFFAAAIAAIDARHFIIPDELNLAALALALVNASIQHPDTAVGAIAFSRARAPSGFSFSGCRPAIAGCAIGKGSGQATSNWQAWRVHGSAGRRFRSRLKLLPSPRSAVTRRTAGLPVALRPTSRLPFGLFLAPAIWFGWFLETLWSAP